jgi:hypothetical protein
MMIMVGSEFYFVISESERYAPIQHCPLSQREGMHVLGTRHLNYQMVFSSQKSTT